MESNFESKISEQSSTIGENEKKLNLIGQEKSALEQKASQLQKELDQANKVGTRLSVAVKMFFGALPVNCLPLIWPENALI